MDFSADKLARLEKARQVETLGRADIDQYQRSQLPQAVAITAKSPFWRERFGQAGFDPSRLKDPCDLYAAPAIAKADYFQSLSTDPENYGGLLTESVRVDPPAWSDCVPHERNIRKTGPLHQHT